MLIHVTEWIKLMVSKRSQREKCDLLYNSRQEIWNRQISRDRKWISGCVELGSEDWR
jgi:hypothetical protein